MKRITISESQLRMLTEGDYEDAMRNRISIASKNGAKGKVTDFINRNDSQARFDVMLKKAKEGKKGKVQW